MLLELFRISPHWTIPIILTSIIILTILQMRKLAQRPLTAPSEMLLKQKTQAQYFSMLVFFLIPLLLKSTTVKAEWSIISLEKC